MSWIEIIAVASSVVYVVLAAYQNSWCWLFSLISVSLYLFIYLEIKLYGEASLQVFYIGSTVFGWLSWKNYLTSEKEDLKVATWGISLNLLLILVTVLFGFVIGWLMEKYFDSSLPYIDAMIFSSSIMATILQTRKLIENWIWFIIIDFVSIFLHINRELHLSAFLYLLFTFMAIFALYKWKKEWSDVSQ